MLDIPTATTYPSTRPALRVVRDEESPPYDADFEPPAVRGGGFAIIPRPVLDLHDGNCIAVYAVLAGHANEQRECWPSVGTLAEETGFSDRKVAYVLQRLEEAGIIERERRANNGMKAANLYRLVEKPAKEKIRNSCRTFGNSCSQDTQLLQSGSAIVADKQEPIELEPVEQDPPLSPTKKRTKRTSTLAGFDEWYALYPRHEAPADAEKAWAKLTEAQRAACLVAIKAQIHWPKMIGDPRYIPLPATWLNGSRWRDELTVPPNTNGRNPFLGDWKPGGPPPARAAEDFDNLKAGMTPIWGAAEGGLDHL